MLNSFKKLTKVFTNAPAPGGQPDNESAGIVTVVQGPHAQQARRVVSPAASDIAQVAATRTAEVLALLQDSRSQPLLDRSVIAKGAADYKLTPEDVSGINLAAGDQLLRIYEKRWREINQQHLVAADKARMARGKGLDMQRYCDRVHRIVTDADRAVFQHLPELTKAILDISVAIERLKDTIHMVEHGLGELEAARDEADTQRGVMTVTQDLEKYRLQMRRQYDNIKDNYEARLKLIEAKKHQREARELAEKQAEYEERHRKAMAAYRQAATPDLLGSICRSNEDIGTTSKGEGSTRLEDVDIRDMMDRGDLDDFLKDVDGTISTDWTSGNADDPSSDSAEEAC